MNGAPARRMSVGLLLLLQRWRKLVGAAIGAAIVGAVLFGMQVRIDEQQRRYDLKVARARDNIVAITNIRRDGRKTQVAILERWLAPQEQWQVRGDETLNKAFTVINSTRDYAEDTVLRNDDAQHVGRLARAAALWAEVIRNIVASGEGQQSLSRLNAKFNEIDQECNAILSATEATAKWDDREVAKLNRQEVAIHYAGLVVILALISGVLVQLAKAKAAAEVHKSEKAVLETTRKLVDALPFAVMLVDKEGVIRRANETAAQILNSASSELVGRSMSGFLSDHETKDEGAAAKEIEILDTQGRTLSVLYSAIPIFIEGEQVTIEAFVDVSERRSLELRLRHSQKLESVGQLAAGIAHEINTPAQYVGDSIQFLAESFESARVLYAMYRKALATLQSIPGQEQLVHELTEVEDVSDFEYIEQHAPAAFARAAEGVARIAGIVSAMKDFAHPDSRTKSPADINRAIQATLTIARNEYKYVAEVETEFGELPQVTCHLSDINQVILNLLVNAAHAISDVVGSGGSMGRILVRTSAEAGVVRIEISDTGAGIPPSIRDRVFDPFFTTKEVGKGSGQGLAIARSIVEEKHGGSLRFESELGKGSTFTIWLPIDGGASNAPEAVL